MTAPMDIGCFDREVQVQFRDVFGRPLCYPMNTTASRFCTLTGNLTLSPTDLKVIEALGFTVTPVMYAPTGASA
jgi:hypothetical protein|tara:strand:- start:866 stop:1087 length:222 start_codon:yes stop_codon:yes gene_type:complete